MEELRSTEILDKEIHEDARKKAEKILSDADSECKKILEAVSNRIESVRKEKEAVYAEKLASDKKNSEASVPLEQERFLVSFESDAVMVAINNYLQKLEESKQLTLIKNLLNRYKDVLGAGRIKAQVFGFDLVAVESLLKDVFGSPKILECTQISYALSGAEDPVGLELHKGIILETQDDGIRCRATLGEVVAELIDAHSFELAQTLFCGRLPQ